MNDGNRDTAGVIMPPPLLFAGALLLGLLLDWQWPTAVIGGHGQYWLGGALFGAGLLLVFNAMRAFKRAGTNVEPYKPTTAIVTDGPYRYSRNPIYVALFLAYFGIAVAVDSLWLLALALPLYFVMISGVIAREERYLERKFGDEYLRYKASVRRWL